MPALSTRGDLASAIYNALGIDAPTSSGVFGDSGNLDSVLSTLSDIGVTNGIAPGQFAPGNVVTRGEAFTMIARALGLVDNRASFADAAQALVSHNIVKGFADGSLGLDQPLDGGQLDLLMNRVSQELPKQSGTTPGQTIADTVADRVASARDTTQRRQDPAFAAFLRTAGLRQSQIRDEISSRIDATNREISRRAAGFEQAAKDKVEGIGQDFENRGLFRSGVRARKQSEGADRINQSQLDFEAATNANLAAQNRASQADISNLDVNIAEKRFQSQHNSAVTDINKQVDAINKQATA